MTYAADEQDPQQARGAGASAPRRVDARHASRSTSRRRRSSTTIPSSTRTSTTAAGRSRARPSTSPSARPAARSATSSGAGRSADVRRLDAPRRTADHGRLSAFLGHYPTLRFKLDARPDWTGEVIAELASRMRRLGRLQGPVPGTGVDKVPDPALYRRVVDALPDAWLEDPALTPETDPGARAAHRARSRGTR